MASAEQTARPDGVPRPYFADAATVERLLGVPENTLRRLACEMKVAAHKLRDGKQGKCVYLFSDVEDWVKARPVPEWVERYQRNLKARCE